MLVLQNETSSRTRILEGKNCYALFNDSNFIESWNELYKLCKWSTVFQSPEFVITWYKNNENLYIPIICLTYNDNKLTGLLTLALSFNDLNRKKGLIVGAGNFLGEYQTWITTEENGDQFIKEALTLVINSFPNNDILLKYITPNTPLNWIEDDIKWKKRSVIQKYKRALINLSAPDAFKIFSKQEFKRKQNYLKNLGELEIEKILSKQRFEEIFDEITILYDFRQEAKYNRNQFVDNLFLNKNFMLPLFEQNILHVTVLKLNTTTIATMVGFAGKKSLHLVGLNAHSPFFGKGSPGFVHFVLLSKLLKDEDYNLFDLTPGGDYYKERLANAHDEVYELRIVNTLKYRIKSFIKLYVYNLMHRSGIRPLSVMLSLKRKLYIAKHRIKKIKPHNFHQLFHQYFNNSEALKLLYLIDINNSEKLSHNKNSLQDLLKFDQNGSRITRWEFLERAEERFKNGQQAYSFTKNNSLVCCAWVIDRGTNNNTLQIDELYCHPNHLTHLSNFLSAFANDQSINSQIKQISLQIDTNDKNLLMELKKIGFRTIS